MVKHYDFSLQAFEAYTASDHDRALVLIDSAFQYTFGYWEIQYSAIDKNLNIYFNPTIFSLTSQSLFWSATFLARFDAFAFLHLT